MDKAYIDYLYSTKAQDIAGRHYYRPRDKKMAAKYAEQFPRIDLYTIDEISGSWKAAQATHFDDGGILDQIQGKSNPESYNNPLMTGAQIGPNFGPFRAVSIVCAAAQLAKRRRPILPVPIPIYVCQRTEPLRKKRDYCTVGSRCGAEHEYAFSCVPLATLIQSTLEKKKHESPK